MRVHPRPAQVGYSLALSADARLLAAAGFESTVRIYEVASGQEVQRFAGPCADLRSVVFSPDGKHLAVAGRTGQIRIWSLADAQIWLDIAADTQRIRSLAYAPGSDMLASAGEGRSIALWETQGGKLLGRMTNKSKVMALEFCGASRLASGGTNNLVHVWDIRQQAEEFQLAGHTGTVTALDYDARTDVLVSASFDTTVRVWPLKA
jgi:WD40 repeat protein